MTNGQSASKAEPRLRHAKLRTVWRFISKLFPARQTLRGCNKDNAHSHKYYKNVLGNSGGSDADDDHDHDHHGDDPPKISRFVSWHKINLKLYI